MADQLKEAQDLILRAAENPASITDEELRVNLPLGISLVLVRSELLGARRVGSIQVGDSPAASLLGSG